MKRDDYKSSQPYQLGLIYAELGAALMNPKTDLRDLVALTARLGMRIDLTVSADEISEPASAQGATGGVS